MANDIDADDIDADDIDAIDEIDTLWHEHFKAAEYTYNQFYREPVTTVRLYLLYVNQGDLIAVKRAPSIPAENGWVKRDRVMALLKHYQTRGSVKYKLHSVLRHNIDLQPEDIATYVHTTAPPGQFLTAVKYLDDIHYADSIPLFHDLNALYFMYAAPSAPLAMQTKKIKLTAGTHKTMRNRPIKNLKITKEIK
jgi:hypothetical protein